MKIKFEFDVNVRVEGMEGLISAIRGDLSESEKGALGLTLDRLKRHVRKLERLDRETQPEE